MRYTYVYTCTYVLYEKSVLTRFFRFFLCLKMWLRLSMFLMCFFNLTQCQVTFPDKLDSLKKRKPVAFNTSVPISGFRMDHMTTVKWFHYFIRWTKMHKIPIQGIHMKGQFPCVFQGFTTSLLIILLAVRLSWICLMDSLYINLFNNPG